mgnify:CR=1 FL=1|tara:strand:+ start:851 stop:1354 length:504 start_codon:yes stop_codon:yes gene_type:complete
MNIFYLDKDVNKCAQYHNDKHCVKMILEYAQLLCTAHWELDVSNQVMNNPMGLYKPTHKNHPSAVWVRQSKKNYEYLYSLFNALCHEYSYRYGKIHLTYSKLHNVLATPPQNIPDKEFTQPTPAMPDDVKDNDSINAYRKYYNKYKQHLAKWTNREVPEWIKMNVMS